MATTRQQSDLHKHYGIFWINLEKPKDYYLTHPISISLLYFKNVFIYETLIPITQTHSKKDVNFNPLIAKNVQKVICTTYTSFRLRDFRTKKTLLLVDGDLTSHVKIPIKLSIDVILNRCNDRRDSQNVSKVGSKEEQWMEFVDDELQICPQQHIYV